MTRVSLFNRIDRSIFRQLWTPFALGLGAFLFMLSMRLLFTLGEMVIRKGAPLSLVFGLLLVNLPRLLILIVPAGGLLAVLVVYGRLASDSEITALRAAGVPLRRQARAAVIFGLVLTAAGLLLTHTLVPLASRKSRDWSDDLIRKSDLLRTIKPHEIFDQIPGMTLYVEGVDLDQRRLLGIFVHESREDGSNQLSLARSGSITLDEASGRINLSLEAGHTYEFPADNPYNLRETSFAVQQVGGQLPQTSRFAPRDVSTATVWQLSSSELNELLARGTTLDKSLRRAARLENLTRNTLPIAALLLCLLAVPLSLSAARGGRGAALGIALLVFALYAIVQSALINMSTAGKLSPWIAALLAPLLLGAAAQWLLIRRSRRDATREWQWRWRLQHWFAARWKGRRKETDEEAAAPGLAESEAQVAATRFRPRLLDRYIAGTVFRYVGFSLLAIVMMGLLIDLRGVADDAVKNHSPLRDVVWLLLTGIPELIMRIMPYAVLIGVLVGFSALSRQSELIAMRAAGISIWRQGRAVLILAGVCSLVMFAAGEWLVAPASATHWQMMEKVKNRRFMGGHLDDKAWLFGSQPGSIYHFDLVQSSQPGGSDLLMNFTHYRVDFEAGTLVERLNANVLENREGKLVARNGLLRRREGDGWSVVALHDTPVDLPDPPAYFHPTERLDALSMSARSLWVYGKKVEQKKLPGVEGVWVDFHGKFAWPAACLVMAMLGLAFAFRTGRGGSMLGIGIGLGLGIIYSVLDILLSQIGATALEPPLLAAWGANGIALIAALFWYAGEPT